MAKYTTELKTIVENFNGLTKPASGAQIPGLIQKAIPLIFNFDYQITDKSHKPVLEQKIIQHYIFREIGFETVGLWQLKLAFKMSEIMPYYDELYKSANLQFDPLTNYKYTENATSLAKANSNSLSDSNANSNNNQNQTTTSENSTHSTASSNQSDTGKDVNAYSETPQGSLQGVETLTYLTDARIIDSSNKVDTDQTGDTTANESSDLKLTQDTTNTAHMQSQNDSTNQTSNTLDKNGYQGVSPSEMLTKYRETILNIDLMVIDALADLFMQIY